MRRRTLVSCLCVGLAGCAASTDSPTDTPTPTSNFEIGAVTVEQEVHLGERVQVDVTVTNTGDIAGAEIVYVKIGGTTVVGEEINLEPGAEEELSGKLDTSVLGMGSHDVVVEFGGETTEKTLEVVYDYGPIATDLQESLREVFVNAEVVYVGQFEASYYTSSPRDVESMLLEADLVLLSYLNVIEEYEDAPPEDIQGFVYGPNGDVIAGFMTSGSWIEEWLNDEISLRELKARNRRTFST